MLRVLCIFFLALSVHTGKIAVPLQIKKTTKPPLVLKLDTTQIKKAPKASLVLKLDTAQVKKTPKAPLALKLDTAQVNVRRFDSTALKTYSKHPEFQYNEDDAQSAPSWWTRFWRWFWNWFTDLFKPVKLSHRNYSPFIRFLVYALQYLAIGAGLGALVFLGLKMAGVDMLNVFRKKSMSANLPYLESLENIHDINFDDELEKAVVQHNYRLAVRLLYLKCLKQLSDADLIKWQIDKTNSAYINELTNPEQRRVFKTLTLQFEYTWYGEFAIDASVFKNINALFLDFKKGIV